MYSIYPKLRRKFKKGYGDKGMEPMNEYIMEKYCLRKEEQIVYKLEGTISQKVPKVYEWIRVQKGTIYITSERIIALGRFDVCPHTSFAYWVLTEGSTKSRKKAEKSYIYSSTACYGYKFPTSSLRRLKKDTRKLTYFCGESRIKIIPSRKENLDRLFTILEETQIRKNV